MSCLWLQFICPSSSSFRERIAGLESQYLWVSWSQWKNCLPLWTKNAENLLFCTFDKMHLGNSNPKLAQKMLRIRVSQCPSNNSCYARNVSNKLSAVWLQGFWAVYGLYQTTRRPKKLSNEHGSHANLPDFDFIQISTCSFVPPQENTLCKLKQLLAIMVVKKVPAETTYDPRTSWQRKRYIFRRSLKWGLNFICWITASWQHSPVDEKLFFALFRRAFNKEKGLEEFANLFSRRLNFSNWFPMVQTELKTYLRKEKRDPNSCLGLHTRGVRPAGILKHLTNVWLPARLISP